MISYHCGRRHLQDRHPETSGSSTCLHCCWTACFPTLRTYPMPDIMFRDDRLIYSVIAITVREIGNAKRIQLST